jgi:hypothetical protein
MPRRFDALNSLAFFGKGLCLDVCVLTFGTFALIWPFVSVGLAVGAVLLITGFQDRAYDRKLQDRAERRKLSGRKAR